jgi:purine-cytosine permease-like protein
MPNWSRVPPPFHSSVGPPSVGARATVVQGDFFGFLVSFVQLLACGIATWSAVFIVDMAMRRGFHGACLESNGLIKTSRLAPLAAGGGVRLAALIAWPAGTVVGLLFTASPLFTGPLAVGIFAQSSLGYLLGFTVSAALYAMLSRDLLHQRNAAPPVRATPQDEAVNVASYPPGRRSRSIELETASRVDSGPPFDRSCACVIEFRSRRR